MMNILDYFNVYDPNDLSAQDMIIYMYPILDHLPKNEIVTLCERLLKRETLPIPPLTGEVNWVKLTGNMSFIWAMRISAGLDLAGEARFKAFIIGHLKGEECGVILDVISRSGEKRIYRALRSRGFSEVSDEDSTFYDYQMAHKPNQPYVLAPFEHSYYTYTSLDPKDYWMMSAIKNPFIDINNPNDLS